MTREELLELIAAVERHRSELDDVEVKAAQRGTPQRLYESLSAFANRPGGGVLLFGLDERAEFKVVGVGNAQKLQEDVSNLCVSEMEPALRPDFTVEPVEGKTVVAVEVAQAPADRRPCYYKPAGPQKGAYIRVGNTNRQMTDYEIFGFVSAHAQPTFDEEPVPEATLADLDRAKLEDYLARLRQARPGAGYFSLPFEQALAQLRLVREVGGVLRPTLAGLLAFGTYPQRFEPQMVITFLQYYGTTEMEKAPGGERFLDNRKFEGAIPGMVEGAIAQVLASIRKGSLIDGLFRRDVPEYPIEAVREAVVNAVAHRDYSPYVRGSYIQIRLFADRLEIQSPGGLYGNVTEDTLEDEQSTRNRLLMRLMEDLHLVENRGSGIRAMLAALRAANLQPPRFQDKRSSFWVTFFNHTLLGPEALTWLGRFGGLPLNDRQRLALVYLRHNERITNGDYRRLNNTDIVTANRELRGLTQLGLADQHDTRRWAHYVLSSNVDKEIKPQEQTDRERILGYAKRRGSITRMECAELLGVSENQARYVLRKLRDEGLLHLVGVGRGARYVPR